MRAPQGRHPGPAARPLPARYRDAGQPVLVPGSMGTGSYVLAGVRGGGAFFSACHGAGRRLSRHQALRHVRGETLRADLERAGIAVRGTSLRGLAEEAPEAYKDVDAVVAVCERAGLARTVARLRPLGVVKMLDDVIYQLDVHARLPAGISIELPPAGAPGSADVRYALVPATQATVTGAIPKAVTRHELRFARDGDRWYCHVTVDT